MDAPNLDLESMVEHKEPTISSRVFESDSIELLKLGGWLQQQTGQRWDRASVVRYLLRFREAVMQAESTVAGQS